MIILRYLGYLMVSSSLLIAGYIASNETNENLFKSSCLSTVTPSEIRREYNETPEEFCEITYNSWRNPHERP
jgi:hypothetical protein